jgi:hypothetical protein
VSAFKDIMRRAVEATPDAVGGAFADSTGEMVDSWPGSMPPNDWAILTAHYGVILAHLHAAFGIWHFGGPEYFVAQHQHVGIVVHALDGGYYALLALDRRTKPVSDAFDIADITALDSLRAAARDLHREMA